MMMQWLLMRNLWVMKDQKSLIQILQRWKLQNKKNKHKLRQIQRLYKTMMPPLLLLGLQKLRKSKQRLKNLKDLPQKRKMRKKSQNQNLRRLQRKNLLRNLPKNQQLKRRLKRPHQRNKRLFRKPKQNQILEPKSQSSKGSLTNLMPANQSKK